jgi:hypothetical protein
VDAEQPKPEKYDYRLEESEVNDAKRVIKKLERAFKHNEFPETSCDGCRDCPFWDGCRGYAQWATKNPRYDRRNDGVFRIKAPVFSNRGFVPYEEDAPVAAELLPFAAAQTEIAA